MDPISAIFVMVVLTGAFAKGVDVATDGLLSAEVGGGVRGVSHYAVQAGKARWRLANAKAREIRTQSPQGRKVQEILDLAGMFVRVLSGEAVRFGSGVRSSWRSGREQERSVRTERRGDAPWPVTQWLQERLVRVQESRTKTPNEEAEQPHESPNGDPEQPEPEGKLWGEVVRSGGCLEVTRWVPEGGANWPRYCDAEREPGWVLCPEHLKARRADPDYPNDDIDEFRDDADAYRHVSDPNGDPDDIWQDPPVTGTVCPPTNRPLCERCGERPWTTRYRDPWGGQIGGSIDSALGHPLHICDQCAREIEAERKGDPDPNGKLWGEVARGGGCIEVTGWVVEGGQRWPRYCGEPREPGWVLCPTHLAAKHADPNYPQDDIDEYREDPDHLGPDDYRSIPDPDTDPAPTMKGTSMDINSAPVAIDAWEAFAPRWESLQSQADALQGEIDSLTNEAAALHGEIATLADGMGDFAVGGEADTAAAVGELSDAATSAKEKADVLAATVGTAKQAVDSYLDNLEADLRPGIEAAAGKVADVHAVMQEA